MPLILQLCWNELSLDLGMALEYSALHRRTGTLNRARPRKTFLETPDQDFLSPGPPKHLELSQVDNYDLC